MSRTVPKPAILILLSAAILLVGCHQVPSASFAARQPVENFGRATSESLTPVKNEVSLHVAPSPTYRTPPPQDADLTGQLADSMMDVLEVFTGRR
jgi:hypothetical protein